MIQSEHATVVALAAHRAAVERRHAGGTLEDVVRMLVKRWKRDGYKGTNESWQRLARLIDQPKEMR